MSAQRRHYAAPTMLLPERHRARVDRSKITEYLLCKSHLDGSAEAAFFVRFGFNTEAWEVLAEALHSLGVSNPVVGAVTSSHGMRYTVKGLLQCPDGRHPRVRTVWIMEADAPRLVTAYPM
ncbi:MAG: DUF6883 domain-containing protein [Gammaproteobacteria bacterium]